MLDEGLDVIERIGGVVENVVEDEEGDAFEVGFGGEGAGVECGGAEVEEGGFLADLVDCVAICDVGGGGSEEEEEEEECEG